MLTSIQIRCFFPPALLQNIRKKKNHRHPKTAYSVKCAAFLMGNSSFFARRAMFSSLRCPKVSLSNTCTVFKAMLPLKEPEVSPFWAENRKYHAIPQKKQDKNYHCFSEFTVLFSFTARLPPSDKLQCGRHPFPASPRKRHHKKSYFLSFRFSRFQPPHAVSLLSRW